MERYSQVFESKRQCRYSEKFKRRLCQEYLNGNATLRSLEKHYRLGNSRISSWLKTFGLQVKSTIYLPSPIMPSKKVQKDIVLDEDSSVRLLKKQLEEALLEKELYRRMIEVAERDLKIKIRKKSVTK